MNEEPRHCVDAVVRDACEGTKAQGLIPDIKGVTSFVQDIVERMDRKEADNAHKWKPKPEPKPKFTGRVPDALIKEANLRFSRRGMEGLATVDWEVTRNDIAPPPPKKLAYDRMCDYSRELLKERIVLLRSKPDYRARLETLNPLAIVGQLGPEKKIEACHLWMSIIEESEVHFGPWWKEPPAVLFFT